MSLRDRKKLKMRELILDEVEELFTRKGYEETGIEEIVSRCEISKPTFYNYFESKQAVAHAVAQRLHSQVSASVRAARNQHNDPVAQVLEITDAWSNVITERQLLYRSLIVSNAVRPIGDPDQLEQEDQLYSLFIEIAKAALTRQWKAISHTPEELAQLLVSTIVSTSVAWSRDPRAFKLKLRLRKHIRLMLL